MRGAADRAIEFSRRVTQSGAQATGGFTPPRRLEQSMQLAPTRFVRIEGTEVMVSVNSSLEARKALKELSHKKRELAHLKRALLRQQKSQRRRQAQAGRRPSALWSIFDPRKKLVRAVTAVAAVFRPPAPQRDADEIARELRRIEEITQGIDSCRLQIEGKLISLT
jgi:hypothetical protein